MKPETVHVGIDIGYGDVKVATSTGREFSFPSHTAEIDDPAMLANDMKERVINEQGRHYLIGHDATISRNVRQVHIDSSRIETLDFRLLGKHCLSQIGSKHAVITTGLPVKDFQRSRRKLQEVVQGWSDRGHKLTVKRIVPQPLGTFCDVALAGGKGEIDERFRGAKVAIIDIGSGTTDLIEIYDGQLNPSTYTSDAFAVSAAMKIVRNQLLIKHNAEFDISEIPGVVAKGSFENRGKEVSIGSFVREAKRHVVLNALALARRLWGDLRTFRYVLVTGGGAAFLRDELRHHIAESQLLIPDNPASSNARGYLYLAQQSDK